MGEVLRMSFGKGEDGVAIDFDGRSVLGPWGARRIEPRAADVLERLVKAAPGVVSREDLLDGCWPDGDGSDEALTQAVAQLRRAFGDKPGQPRFIETLHRRGYRWIGAAEPATARPRPSSRRWRRNLTALALATAAGFAGGAVLLALKPAPRMELQQETVLLQRTADGRVIETHSLGPPPGLPDRQARSSSPLPSGSLR